jgi:hypothetical protein
VTTRRSVDTVSKCFTVLRTRGGPRRKQRQANLLTVVNLLLDLIWSSSRTPSVGVVGRYTACSKASRAQAAGCGTLSKLSFFPYLRPGGNECRWARFVGNVLVQTIPQKTAWSRNSSKISRFGQDFDPCPNFGLGERHGGERFVVSKPKF